MQTKIILGLGLLAAGLGTLAASCSERFVGCDKTLGCPDHALGGQGGAGGEGAGTGGGNVDTCMITCGDAPCYEGTCVECTGDEHCGDGLCDTARHECVQCLENADCSAETPVCDGGSCIGCTGHADCEHVDGKGLCHDSSGECVECLPGEHESCGAGSLCHGTERKCVEADEGNAPTCGDCVADAHCEDGLRCVAPGRFGEEGYFCLPEATPFCDTRRPFVQELEDRKTIEGETSNVCGHAFTSCAGFNVFRTAVSGCSDAADVGDGDGACGLPGTDDNTRCRAFGGGARCTYRCQSQDDCPCGFDCTGSTGNQVCTFTFDSENECP